jgi:hypothetical protein
MFRHQVHHILTARSPIIRSQPWRVLLTLLAALFIGFASLLQISTATFAQCGEGPELVVFEILQRGFAGSTGERTTIHTNGCFDVVRVLVDRVENIRSGGLGPDQVQQVLTAIRETDLGSVPDLSQDSGRANPVTVSVTHQGVTKRVALPPGTRMERIEALAIGDPNADVGRIAKLLTVLSRLTR